MLGRIWRSLPIPIPILFLEWNQNLGPRCPIHFLGKVFVLFIYFLLSCWCTALFRGRRDRSKGSRLLRRCPLANKPPNRREHMVTLHLNALLSAPPPHFFFYALINPEISWNSNKPLGDDMSSVINGVICSFFSRISGDAGYCGDSCWPVLIWVELECENRFLVVLWLSSSKYHFAICLSGEKKKKSNVATIRSSNFVSLEHFVILLAADWWLTTQNLPTSPKTLLS